MRMRESLQTIYRVLTTDETLLRLLYYKPSDSFDNPLDSEKANILDMDDSQKWAIIQDVIKTTPSVANLDTEPKCRICMYHGTRDNNRNYLIANQKIIFDVLVHFDFDNVDQRLSWICDRLNELMFDKRITGIGRVGFVRGTIIPSSYENYIAYRLIYEFGDFN